MEGERKKERERMKLIRSAREMQPIYSLIDYKRVSGNNLNGDILNGTSEIHSHTLKTLLDGSL